MSRKIYRCVTLTHYSFSVEVDGKPVMITMQGVGISGSKAIYSTSNEKIQNAIEKSGAFNKVFLLHFEEKETPVELPKEGAINDKPKVGNTASPVIEDDADNKVIIVDTVIELQDAKEYLKSIGVAPVALTTKDRILSQAAKRNIEFPNLKV